MNGRKKLLKARICLQGAVCREEFRQAKPKENKLACGSDSISFLLAFGFGFFNTQFMGAAALAGKCASFFERLESRIRSWYFFGNPTNLRHFAAQRGAKVKKKIPLFSGNREICVKKLKGFGEMEQMLFEHLK